MIGFTQSSYPALFLLPSDEDYKTLPLQIYRKGTKIPPNFQNGISAFYEAGQTVNIPAKAWTIIKQCVEPRHSLVYDFNKPSHIYHCKQCSRANYIPLPSSPKNITAQYCQYY